MRGALLLGLTQLLPTRSVIAESAFLLTMRVLSLTAHFAESDKVRFYRVRVSFAESV